MHAALHACSVTLGCVHLWSHTPPHATECSYIIISYFHCTAITGLYVGAWHKHNALCRNLKFNCYYNNSMPKVFQPAYISGSLYEYHASIISELFSAVSLLKLALYIHVIHHVLSLLHLSNYFYIVYTPM